jgi:hypothetical protein
VYLAGHYNLISPISAGVMKLFYITLLSLAAYSQLPALSFSGSFTSSGSSGTLGNYENLGTIDEAGTSTVSDQIAWSRASNGSDSAVFSIAEGFIVSAMSAFVPNNAASPPQDGTFTFGIYDGSSITTSIWQIGDSTPTVGSGTYAIEWFVPAKGQGGSSSAAGNGGFSITVEAIPEPSSCALIFGCLALASASLSRSKR